MNHWQEEFSRFQDWKSEKTSEGNFHVKDGVHRSKVVIASNELHKGLEPGKWRVKSIIQAVKSSLSGFVEESLGSNKNILDPQGPFLQKWNKIFVLSCVIAISLDPLFLYIPVIDNDNKCLGLDRTLEFYHYHRVLRVYPLYNEVTRTSGILTETAWAGAAFNLFLYMLASHVLGAFWYLFSIERETTCWKQACGNSSACRHASMFCDDDHTGFKSLLNISCPIETPNATLFDFGIFLDALQSDVVGSTSFPQKFFIVSGGVYKI